MTFSKSIETTARDTEFAILASRGMTGYAIARQHRVTRNTVVGALQRKMKSPQNAHHEDLRDVRILSCLESETDVEAIAAQYNVAVDHVIFLEAETRRAQPSSAVEG